MQTDEELVSALRDGCDDALAVLFERHKRLAFYVARNILRDEGEAEEAVQQAFFDMYRAINRFDSRRGSFKSWMLQYAYHRSINRREHLLAKHFYDFEEFVGVEFPGRAIQEPKRLVAEILSMLKPQQRRVIELTYFDGLTAEEIATKTGETAAAVRHHLYRGIAQLRAILDRQPQNTGLIQAVEQMA